MAQPNQIKEYTGTVIRWIHTYGFMSIDENDEYDTGMNVFVHISQIKHQLNESDPVTFKIVVQSDGRLRAIDVSLLDTPGCESEVVWQFCENNDSWIDMNNIVSNKIEFAKENIIIPVQIGKWMYKIVKLDTTTGYQINTTTGTKRNIRKSGESEKISVQLFEEEKEIVSHRIIVGLPDYKTQKIHADTMEKINTEKKEIKTKLHDQYDENGYKTIAIIVCIIVASAVILCGYLLLQHASKIHKKQATESDYSDRPFVILAGFIFILSSICGCVSICFCATCIGTLCNDCSDMSHSCYEICYTIPKQEREELKEMRNRYYFNAWKRMIKTDQLDYYISYCQKQCKMELSNDICGVIYDYYNVNLNQTHIDMINIHKDNIKTKTDTQKLNIKNQHEQLHLNKKDKNIPVHGISPFIPITNNHILTIQNKITDNTLLNSYKQTCKNISKLTDPIKKFIKRTIYLKYTYIPYQQRKLSSLCIKQYSTPSFEAIEYKKDLELESILSMRGYLNYVNNKTNELIDLLQIIIDNIKSTRNKYQTKITKLELNPRGSKFTLPSLHLNKYRVELSTYEHFVDERITTYIYNLNIQFKRLFKEISRVLIDDNIIQSEIIYTENEWNDLEDIKKYIMGNINKTKDKENIIDFNQIIKIQQNKNDEQKELDIITKWKVNYIENPFFKPQRDDQEKPKYNFNYLQFKQYNIHIKHSIIKKHGNKSDKIYLPKHLKNKNYKRKQYKHQW